MNNCKKKYENISDVLVYAPVIAGFVSLLNLTRKSNKDGK